jgi:hypothetical protein
MRGKQAMALVWICELSPTHRVFHVLGGSGIVGKTNRLAPAYLSMMICCVTNFVGRTRAHWVGTNLRSQED